MKKIILAVAAVAVVGLAVWRHQVITRAPETDKPIVKIGVLAPLSGNVAIMGKPVRGAIEVAAADLNARDNRYFYQIIFEDHLNEPMRAATIVKKLVFVDKVDALISFNAPPGHVVAPVAEENKIPHISLCSDAKVASGKYNFINWTQPESEARKMTEMIKKKGYKSVALAVLNHQGALAISDALVSELNAVGIQNRTWTFNGGVRNFRIEIEKMKRAIAPDLYMVLFFDPELTLFIRQLRDSGAKTDVTGIETFSIFSNPAVLSELEGAWYVDAAEGSGETMERIKAHNKSEATFDLGNGYDSLMILAKAFEAAPDKAGAIDVLAAMTEYDGLLGRLTRKGNVFDSEAAVKIIRGGKAVVEEVK
ncbi:MAG: ABC transporter substrate-binding protein [Alphaproteobacteria bacterium]|nr:ABC transporter substrate-binding protein [Alphaproteobacteria bacterium]